MVVAQGAAGVAFREHWCVFKVLMWMSLCLSQRSAATWSSEDGDPAYLAYLTLAGLRANKVDISARESKVPNLMRLSRTGVGRLWHVHSRGLVICEDINQAALPSVCHGIKGHMPEYHYTVRSERELRYEL